MSTIAVPQRQRSTATRSGDGHPVVRRLLTTAVLLAVVLALLLAVPALRKVFTDMRSASTGWLVLAVTLELASCASFVVIFRHFFGGLAPRRARQLAWTEMGSGALLPTGGAGALAFGGWLMHLDGVPTDQIVRRSTGLFFLSSAVSVAAMTGGAVLLGTGLSAGPSGVLAWGVPLAAGVAAIGLAFTLRRLAQASDSRLASSTPMRALADGVTEALAAMRHPSWRLAGAIGYLAFDIGVLYAALRAVHFDPPVAVLILGYIIGYIGNLVPVPGSIGVLEGSLVSVLILYGAPAVETTAAVLIYHAVAFWVPSLGGLVGYRLLRRAPAETTLAETAYLERPVGS